MPTTRKAASRWKRTPVKAGRGRDEVQQLLDGLARAITAGDGRAAATMWAVPAIVLGDGMAQCITSAEEVERFFSGAKQQYNERGITDTRAEILRLEWLTDKMAEVDVRWPYLDAEGDESGDESSTYIVRRDDAGDLKVQAALMRGTSNPE
jgi:hypothetical protein